MNKKLKIILAVLGFTFLLSSCNKQNSNKKEEMEDSAVTQNKQPLTIKLGFSTNTEDPRAVAANLFKEIVETKTDNTILIEIYANGTLGSDSDLIQGMIDGSVDMTITSAGNYATFIPKAGLSAIPYLFSNFTDAWNFMDNNIIKEINLSFEEQNMVVLSQFDNGFRCITTSKNYGPIYNLSDLKGLNIRTPHNQIVMETMLALGANPKSSSFTTLKEDILNGKFDAQENPIPVIYNSKLYEVQKYLAITNHSYDAMPLTIRKNLWDQLSQDNQKIIRDAALQAQFLDRKLVKQQTADYLNLLKDEGMIITYPDLESFREATSEVIDFFSPVYGEELISKLKD